MHLNPEQKRAVEHTDGPLMIVAGVGTGKTRVIIHRIEYLIKEKGIKPEDILALTFSEKAAEEMQNRVEDQINIPVDAMHISTFHAFCWYLLNRYGERAGFSPELDIIKDVDIRILIRSLLPDLSSSLKHFLLNYDPRSTIDDICGFISKAKNEMVQPDDLRSYLENPDTEDIDDYCDKLEDIALIFEAYGDKNAAEGTMDYGDQIINACILLKENPKILQSVQKRFRYLLVDEFQDTNPAQIELLRLLTKANKNICVVGDDNQAIYRFRGALSGSFGKFQRMFPGAGIVGLLKNYRSTKNILACSASSIRNNPATHGYSHVLLETANEKGDPVHYVISENDEVEAQTIAKLLKSRIRKDKQNNTYATRAVLYRAHSHAKLLIRECIRNDIPHKVLKPGQLLNQPWIKLIISYMQVLSDSEDHSYFYYILQRPDWGLSIEEFTVLYSRMQDLDFTPLELLIRGDFKNIVSGVTYKKLLKLKELLHVLRPDSDEISAVKVVESILQKTGITTKLLLYRNEENEEKLIDIVKFYNFVFEYCEKKGDITFFEFMDYLDRYMFEGGDPGKDVYSDNDPQCVKFLTAHASKGLEFDEVYIISLSNRRFPQGEKKDRIPFPEALTKADEQEGDIHIREERRLFYVAMTRAKKNLVLSVITRKRVKPSPFFTELIENPELKSVLVNMHSI